MLLSKQEGGHLVPQGPMDLPQCSGLVFILRAQDAATQTAVSVMSTLELRSFGVTLALETPQKTALFCHSGGVLRPLPLSQLIGQEVHSPSGAVLGPTPLAWPPVCVERVNSNEHVARRQTETASPSHCKSAPTWVLGTPGPSSWCSRGL